MGLLGAMAGAGKGLTDYADTLKEKEKMDWLAQQEAVKHERAMNLEKMREAGMEKRLGTQITSTEGMQGKQIQSTEGIAGANITSAHLLQGKQIASSEGIAREGNEAAMARQISSQEGSQNLARLQGQIARANVPVGEINGLPVYADEQDKMSDPNFKRLSDSALDAKLKEATTLQAAEDEVAKKKWAEVSSDPAFKKLPESLQVLTEVQYSISGDVDISKLLAGQAAGAKGGNRKAPTAEHLKVVMDSMIQDPTVANLPPVAQLAIAGKVAGQIANDEDVSWEGKVVPAGKYAEFAREFANGKRNWVELKFMDAASIMGISEAYENIHPSTNLGSNRRGAAAVSRAGGSEGRAGVLQGSTVDTTTTPTRGSRGSRGTAQGKPLSEVLVGLKTRLDELRANQGK